MRRWDRIGRQWRTVRHFRPEQILWRIYQRGLSSLCSRAATPLYARLGMGVPAETPVDPFLQVPLTPDLLDRADKAAAGRFSFLSQEVDYATGVDWDAKGCDRLWRFNLHYFDYGLDLALAFRATGESRYADACCRLAADWDIRVSFARHDGWHPYPLSLRLVNCVFSYHLLGERLAGMREEIRTSMWRQLNYLSLHLERDVGGNHLIKNAKALAIGGAFFGASRLMERGLGILEDQIERQVLSDGGHFERSPMYHEQVLLDLCETAWYLHSTRGLSSPSLNRAIRQMGDWLAKMVLPDGEIPLFGDSALGIAPAPGAILAMVNALAGTRHAAQGNPLTSAMVGPSPTLVPEAFEPAVELLESSGFVITRWNEQMLVMDCGPFAPEELPAHGHCDALSFELCLGSERFIVDSGTYSYTGPWRQAFRGTAAHNTVVLPGREQTEIWGDFRAGRRARIDTRDLRSTGSGWYFEASHDGFRPAIHRRRMWVVPGVFWVIEDELTGGSAEGISLLHLHPDRQLVQNEGGADLHGSGSTLQIRSFGMAFRWTSGYYAPHFGEMPPGPILELPLIPGRRTGYLLAPHGRAIDLRVEASLLEVRDGANRYVLTPSSIQGD